MKQHLKAKIYLALLLPVLSSGLAQAEVSGNVSLQSDYVWRGISQNAEDPAIQGGFDITSESGFYAGVWGSSVDFGGPESTELDLYLGYATEFDNGIGLDIGAIEYSYHGGSGAGNSDFTEYYVGLSYAGFEVTYYIGDEFDDNIEVNYSHEFTNSGISFGATYGDYDTYNYYQVGVSGSFGGESDIGWDVSYWDTDIDNDPNADGRLVVTISKEF